MSQSKTVGFAGLSHLGIIYSAAASARGFSVVAFDPRPGLADELMAGRFPVREPGLEALVQENRALIRYTAEVEAVASCELIFISLDVATDDNNNCDLSPLHALIEQLALHALPHATLVIMSQVPPRFCRKVASMIRQDLRLFYQVETLVFGSAVERAVHPERYMVGCADPEIPPPDLYHRFLDAFECPVLRMKYESAELCKIAINCFLASSVSIANTLAELCEKTGANWSEIVPALHLDRRIGPYAYLNAGLGIAGGNLERDLVTVQKLAAEYGCDAHVVTALQRNSAYARDWVLRRLSRLGLLQDTAHSALAVWGLAYKPDTNSTKNSPSLDLLRALPNYHCRVYDPAAKIKATDFPGVQLYDSPLDALDGADALIVMTAWKEFTQISTDEIQSRVRGGHVVDPYRALNGEALRHGGLNYHCMGA
jgi:UDPglucose 6-dehydrogenase